MTDMWPGVMSLSDASLADIVYGGGGGGGGGGGEGGSCVMWLVEQLFGQAHPYLHTMPATVL